MAGAGAASAGAGHGVVRILLAAAMAAALAGAGHAAEHEIRMLGEGPDDAMAFQPDFVHAAPGDTIRFVAVDGYHNAESIRATFPDGAQAFKGEIGEDVVMTLPEAGVYLVKCKSHYGVGMVALVVVGDLPDRETLARAVAGPHPLRARAAFAAILDAIPEK